MQARRRPLNHEARSLRQTMQQAPTIGAARQPKDLLPPLAEVLCLLRISKYRLKLTLLAFDSSAVQSDVAAVGHQPSRPRRRWTRWTKPFALRCRAISRGGKSLSWKPATTFTIFGTDREGRKRDTVRVRQIAALDPMGSQSRWRLNQSGFFSLRVALRRSSMARRQRWASLCSHFSERTAPIEICGPAHSAREHLSFHLSETGFALKVS